MNYRHAFHAGNFADVVKHIVLVRILLYLQNKEAAFRVIDTHAGSGRYDLTGDEAQRSSEWQYGISRLMAAKLPAEAGALVAPYTDIVSAYNSGHEADQLQAYPGSPLIARALLRPQDSMVVCELEPHARRELISTLRNDDQARVVDIDGWTALNAYIPPKERRGLVLIDPAFEQPDEFERMTKALTGALAKWPGGTYAAWYPAKDRRAADVFAHHIAALTDKCLRVEWMVTPPARDDRAARHVNPPLAAAGLFIVNPPWTLEAELKTLMPAVMAALSPVGGHWLVDQPRP